MTAGINAPRDLRGATARRTGSAPTSAGRPPGSRRRGTRARPAGTRTPAGAPAPEPEVLVQQVQRGQCDAPAEPCVGATSLSALPETLHRAMTSLSHDRPSGQGTMEVLRAFAAISFRSSRSCGALRALRPRAAAPAAAQTAARSAEPSRIRSGGVLPGVTVTVRNVDTALTRTAATGPEAAT